MTIRNDVRHRIIELLGIDEADIDDKNPLFSLVNSSFRIVELVIELQEDFGIHFYQDDMNEVSTVGDLLDLVERRVVEKSSGNSAA